MVGERDGRTEEIESGVSRAAWTVRVAVWSARHRWLVLGGWFLLMFGLFAGSLATGGQRALSIMDNGKSIGESQDGWSALDAARQAAQRGGAKAADVETEWFYLVVSDPRGLSPADRDAVAGMVARLNDATVKVNGRTLPVFWKDPASPVPAVADPFVVAGVSPASKGNVLSADGTTALVTAHISGINGEAEAKALATRPITDGFKTAYPALTIGVLNNHLINHDFGDYVNSSLDSLLPPTLLVAFLILLVAFRAVLAPLVPLGLAVSAIVGAMGLVNLYSQRAAPVAQYCVQIVVLIGLAVAVDYSLFVISRFRTERSNGRDKLTAIEIASATAGRAVVFSGLAVMISLGALLLIDDDIFKSIAVGALSVVLISILGSLTCLPAAISILDRWLLRLRIPLPFAGRSEGQGIWAAIVRLATNRAVLACAGTAAFLVLAVIPTAKLQLGSTTADMSVLPKSVEGVRAWTLLNEKWPQGRDLTIDIVVTNTDAPATKAAIEKLAAALPAGLHEPATVKTPSPGVAVVSYVIPGTPNDRANWQTVTELRTTVTPQYFGGLEGTRAYVTGQTAYTMDYANWYGGQMPRLLLFVLGLSFLLLLVAFHSIVIPIKAIILNLLSAGAAFGVLVLLFQEGWFEAITGIRPNVIEAWAPAMIFTILFGLSMDYEVFILTRVKEAKDRGLSSSDAVLKGITITSGTVTSAAAIMVCVFGAFFTIQLAVIQELGIGLAVAVLVDATLVRSLLLPSTMKLLGDWNWWMPPFLRWVPRITIEGEPESALDAEGASA